MTKVFIGGSRAVSRLNDLIRAQMDDLMRKGCMILIGDANGADKAVQQHFADSQYRNVTVFCMDRCRNNVGGWETRSITSENRKYDFAYYAQKDLAMAREAHCGVMLWDGKSKGTLNNVLNLLHDCKKVLVYYAPFKAFHKLSNEDDFRVLISQMDLQKFGREEDSTRENRMWTKRSQGEKRLPFPSSKAR